MKTYQICSRCVMDTTDPNIVFDNDGICNHCTNAINKLSLPPYSLSSEEKDKALGEIIQRIKKKGEGKKHNCVIGLSGGVDSSYLAYLVKQWGLRPIVVHLDNHWNSEIAEQNINNICKILNFEEERVLLNWSEFKDIQLAFLKASTPDSEIPSDNGIFSLLCNTAIKYKIKYILSGYNVSSESILPSAWSQGHQDKIYIKAVHKRFGKIKNTSIKLISIWDTIYNTKIRKIKIISILDYINYDKEKAKVIISKELNWKNYGRKHGESDYTRIFQEYILPVKFGFDKRKAHFSSLIAAGQMTREEAIKELSTPLYNNEKALKNDINMLCEKFEISKNVFEKIMTLPIKSIDDYPNIKKTIKFKIYNIIRKILGKKEIIL